MLEAMKAMNIASTGARPQSDPCKSSGSPGTTLTLPVRKNPKVAGTKGRNIQVLVNMMAINFSSNFPKNVIHYDITFEPEKPKYMIRPAFDAYVRKYLGNRRPVFDGRKNFYASSPLTIGDAVSVPCIFFQNNCAKINLNKVYTHSKRYYIMIMIIIA